MNQPEARRVDVRLQDDQPSCLGERNIRFGNFPALSQEPEDNGGPVVITLLLTALICLAVGFLGGYWIRVIA